MSRALVIEDHPINLELVTVLLEEMGCQVLAASTPEQGLALATGERPDIIVMDVQLPGMDGYEVTRRLKGDLRTAGIPVVAVTAQALPGEEERARAAGCAAYLAKPVNHVQFRRTIQRFLRPPPGADSPRRSAEG